VALGLSPVLAELVLRWVGDGYDPHEAARETRRMIQAALGVEDVRLEDGDVPGGDVVHASGGRVQATRGEVLGRKAGGVLHPYFGFDNKAGVDLFDRYIEQHLEDPECITILVCGGSVAEQFVNYQSGGGDTLLELMRADPRFAGKKIKTCRLARAGFKQPQHLHALTYFLSCGAVPDYVINIDGLNSIKFGPRNLLYGVPALWPEANHWLHHTRRTELTSEQLERLVETRVRQERLVEGCEQALASGRLRFALFGTSKMKELYRLRDEWARAHETYNAALLSDGIHPTKRDAWSEAQVESADCWYESSRLMHAMCEARGVRYLHFLQPTLYDEGSKPISDQEQAKCVGEKGIDERIKVGYDLLRERGPRLADEGIEFVDTSYLFEDVEETLYFDRAHFVAAGHELLAEEIARTLLGE